MAKQKKVITQNKPKEARKPFEAPEYDTLIHILDNLDDEESNCFVSAIYQFQYAIVRQMDDCEKKES